MNHDVTSLRTSHKLPFTRKSKGGKKTFLNTHEEESIKLVESGLSPADVAKCLIAKYGLAPGSISSKQVSDFIRPRKIDGRIKLPSVSGENIVADYKDSYQEQTKSLANQFPIPSSQKDDDSMRGLKIESSSSEDIDFDLLLRIETTQKFKQLGLFYTFADDEKFYLWFKKIPLTKLVVQALDHDTVLAKWRIVGPSSNVFEECGVRAGKVVAQDSLFSFEIKTPREITVDQDKIIQKQVQHDGVTFDGKVEKVPILHVCILFRKEKKSFNIEF
jgi:hypothetical protein